ncbi:MAG TPA: Gfo/Idh/MocA family oxidoreductase [Phototrophicaceae bacterium]|nr:Gfo/Idh/MocA family oxidoreductase [Phototrophicaceae bacterium]
MRIALLSFAHVHTETYIACLRTIPDVEIIGAADDDAERGRSMTAKVGLRYSPSYEALLAEKPDGVVICCENTRHRELIERALAAGVPYILCEKPLATTMEDGQAIVKVVEAAHAHLMIAFPLRFSAPMRDARQMIVSGKLGKLYGCNTTNHGQNPTRIRSWFTDKRLSGGGAVMDHTVHMVDALRWITGSEIVELYAEAGNLFPQSGIEIDTAGTLMFTFANGAFVGLDCSWSRPTIYPTWGDFKIDFVGERGLITVDAFAQQITTYRQSLGRPTGDFWGSDTDQGMINEFAASIREGRAPSVTAYDGLKATEAAVAAYLSAETHQVVKMPL